MKRLVILCIVIAALGSVAWGVGAILTQTAAARWLDARADQGWVAFTREITVSGYPLDFTTQFHGVELADPETGLAWSTDRFVLEQDVWRLDRIAAIWPADQIIASPQERLDITNTTMAARLDVQPTNRFALDGLQADVTDLAVVSNAGWQMVMAEATLDVVRQPDSDMIYDVTAFVFDMVPPAAWRNRLDPANVLPQAIEAVTYTATMEFDAPWDMSAVEDRRPQITRIEIDEISAVWGNMRFRASGTLEVTPGGVPEGELAVRAENWEAMMDLAANAGVAPDSIRRTAEAILRVLAGMSGRPENIDATLSFSNGRAFLGPLPIGLAPNLRLR